MRIIFDVGANTGGDTSKLASQADTIVYAFEPTWELVSQHLWSLAYKMPNVRVIPFAVDIESGFKKFNIAGNADWGCSSLHDFTDDIHEQWPNRSDFKTTHSYIVPTISLYDFCHIYNIHQIDHLHIDAQGNDLNVLKSLKDKISIVKGGVVEASNKINLYKNVDNGAESIKSFLFEHGFEIYNVTDNDTVGAEINIFFRKLV